MEFRICSHKASGHRAALGHTPLPMEMAWQNSGVPGGAGRLLASAPLFYSRGRGFCS